MSPELSVWWYPTLYRALDHYGRDFIGANLVATEKCPACEKPVSQNLTPHDHHVIPRAFGGLNGPQVRICSPHHNLLHALAESLVTNHRVTVDDLDATVAERVMFLATRAALAQLRTSNEPTKRVITSFYLTAADNQAMLDRLARTSPRMSKQTLMELLVKQFLKS